MKLPALQKVSSCNYACVISYLCFICRLWQNLLKKMRRARLHRKWWAMLLMTQWRRMVCMYISASITVFCDYLYVLCCEMYMYIYEMVCIYLCVHVCDWSCCMCVSDNVYHTHIHRYGSRWGCCGGKRISRNRYFLIQFIFHIY